MALSTQQAKQLLLTDVLARLGCQPVRRKGPDIWYCSPFRQEADPSFKINGEKNLWYDFGEGTGGNILDFAMKYYCCGLSGALHELAHLNLAGKVAEPPPLRTAPEPNPITITGVQPLAHMALRLYLDRRGIDPDLAKRYVQEIHYSREGKPYFALAFASDSGGWEMRNPYFKGVYGPKDVSLLHRERQGDLLVFEGFIDFLSYLTYGGVPEPDGPALVLNSAAMAGKAIAVIKALGASTVRLYPDHDATGRRLLDTFRQGLPGVTVIDESDIYARHKDFNELLQAPLKQGLRR